jgi:hypothetical protein
MDIVEFAERFMNIELKDWQKRHIRTLYELSRDNKIYICMAPGGRVLTYLTPKTVKELINNG